MLIFMAHQMWQIMSFFHWWWKVLGYIAQVKGFKINCAKVHIEVVDKMTRVQKLVSRKNI
jgi:hypothetical protein